MSHYINLNTDWAARPGIAPTSLEKIEALFKSPHSQTDLEDLIDELLHLQLDGYAFVVLSLDISDNGYCHWVKPTFASERDGGSDKLRISAVVTILDRVFQGDSPDETHRPSGL